MFKEVVQAVSLTLFVLLFLVIVSTGLWIGGGFLGLWWYPYSIKQQTAIVRNSNSFISAQQDMLRQFDVSYLGASDPAQKQAILLQMREVAAKIPGYVQPDIQALLQGN